MDIPWNLALKTRPAKNGKSLPPMNRFLLHGHWRSPQPEAPGMRVLGLNAPTTAESGKRPLGRPEGRAMVGALGALGAPQGLQVSLPDISWIPSFWLVSCLDFFIFPYENWEFHNPNWRTPSFFRGVGIPPTSHLLGFPTMGIPQ